VEKEKGENKSRPQRQGTSSRSKRRLTPLIQREKEQRENAKKEHRHMRERHFKKGGEGTGVEKGKRSRGGKQQKIPPGSANQPKNSHATLPCLIPRRKKKDMSAMRSWKQNSTDLVPVREMKGFYISRHRLLEGGGRSDTARTHKKGGQAVEVKRSSRTSGKAARGGNVSIKRRRPEGKRSESKNRR